MIFLCLLLIICFLNCPGLKSENGSDSNGNAKGKFIIYYFVTLLLVIECDQYLWLRFSKWGFWFAENQDVNKQIIEDVLEDKKSIIPVPPQQLQHPSQQLNNINWQCCRRLIYVPRSAQKGYSVGHWPIPEAFWPDMSNPTLVSENCSFKLNQNCYVLYVSLESVSWVARSS